MKLGKLGMLVGAAVGYVLGAKAGRERYEQITASARQLLDKPQVKKVVDSVPGDLGARMEQVANKAADKVQQAGDKVAASGSGHIRHQRLHQRHHHNRTTTPGDPEHVGTSTTTTAKRAASERKAETTDGPPPSDPPASARPRTADGSPGRPQAGSRRVTPARRWTCRRVPGAGQSAPVRSPARARL